MKTSIARTVVLHGVYSNGSKVCPAIITRVWSEHADTKLGPVLVNLTALPDLASPLPIGSVHLYDTEEQALAAMERNNGAGHAAHWPARA